MNARAVRVRKHAIPGCVEGRQPHMKGPVSIVGP